MKLRDLIYLNKSDRNSVVVLILVIIVVILFLIFIDDDKDSSVNNKIDNVDNVEKNDRIRYPKSRDFIKDERRRIDDAPIDCGERQKVVLKKFDPNTADSTTLLGLGLSRWQVRNIYKYRARGGVYRQKSDFAKIYGLTVKQYRMIEPYIIISDDYKEASTLFAKEKRDTVRYQPKIDEGEHVFLNKSDTAELKRVPGIGSGYARAIVRYGKQLGGYVDVTQLMEIKGFPEESLKYFELYDVETVKININKASVSKMYHHPYISFFMAKAIADRRRLEGPIKNIDELKGTRDFTSEIISKLRNYIEY